MGAVEFVPTAIVTLAQVPGLMARVQQALLNVLEAAPGMQPGVHCTFHVKPDQLLRIVLGGFSITYTVDLKRNAAKVLSAAPLDVDVAMRHGLDALSYVD
jgi:hypothetical protein